MKRPATAKRKIKQRRYNTVARHARNLIQPYARSNDADKVIASAPSRVVVLALGNHTPDDLIKNGFFACLWRIAARQRPAAGRVLDSEVATGNQSD